MPRPVPLFVLTALAMLCLMTNLSLGQPRPLAGTHEVAEEIGGVRLATTGVVLGTNGATYRYWRTEAWALTAGLRLLMPTGGVLSGRGDDLPATLALVVGGAYAPPVARLRQARLRPYLAVAVGPFVGYTHRQRRTRRLPDATRIDATFGGQAGAGLRWLPGSRLAVGTYAGYLWTRPFAVPVGSDADFSGLEVQLTLGLRLGRRPGR